MYGIDQAGFSGTVWACDHIQVRRPIDLGIQMITEIKKFSVSVLHDLYGTHYHGF
jgi:hypothetical protein